jgi:hypothetical protein
MIFCGYNYFCRMKRIPLLLFFCLLFTGKIFSQDNGFDIGIIADHRQFSDQYMQSFGLNAYINFDRLTINYQLSIGPASRGGFYVHAPAGAALGGFLLSKVDSNNFGYRILGIAGIISMVVPEGIGYYLSENDKFSTQLIANPLGYEYWKRKNPYEEDWALSGTFLFRFKYFVLPQYHVFIAPEIGPSWIYKNGDIGLKFGVAMGIHPDFS